MASAASTERWLGASQMAACCLKSASKTCMGQKRCQLSAKWRWLCRCATAALLLNITQLTPKWLLQGDCVGTHVTGRQHGTNRALISKAAYATWRLQTRQPALQNQPHLTKKGSVAPIPCGSGGHCLKTVSHRRKNTLQYLDSCPQLRPTTENCILHGLKKWGLVMKMLAETTAAMVVDRCSVVCTVLRERGITADANVTEKSHATVRWLPIMGGGTACGRPFNSSPEACSRARPPSLDQWRPQLLDLVVDFVHPDSCLGNWPPGSFLCG